MKILLPLSWLYRAGVGFRNAYYDRAEAKTLPVPVVSVGNLTMGGSGKTPVVEALSRRLLSRGLPVAVVSRGYGREGRAPFVLVSDGKSVLANAREGGDEPVEIAQKVEGLAVAVGADRYRAGQRLVEMLGPHVLVLDDGFQHRRLARDLDIVCFDCEESGLALLPAGRLREPLSSLERAGAVALTRFREGCETPHPCGIPVLRAVTRVVGFSPVDGKGDRLPADAFRGAPVGLAVGVARPERVKETLDARVVLFETRRDHHRWRAEELEAVSARAETLGAEALLTTGKDAVKLRDFPSAALPLYRIDIEMEILDEDVLRGLLDRLPPL